MVDNVSTLFVHPLFEVGGEDITCISVCFGDVVVGTKGGTILIFKAPLEAALKHSRTWRSPGRDPIVKVKPIMIHDLIAVLTGGVIHLLSASTVTASPHFKVVPQDGGVHDFSYSADGNTHLLWAARNREIRLTQLLSHTDEDGNDTVSAAALVPERVMGLEALSRTVCVSLSHEYHFLNARGFKCLDLIRRKRAPPVVKLLPWKEMLLSTSKNTGVFLDSQGQPSRDDIHWTQPPLAVALQFPFLITAVKGGVHFYSIVDLEFVHELPLDDIVAVCDDGGLQAFVATHGVVYRVDHLEGQSLLESEAPIADPDRAPTICGLPSDLRNVDHPFGSMLSTAILTFLSQVGDTPKASRMKDSGVDNAPSNAMLSAMQHGTDLAMQTETVSGLRALLDRFHLMQRFLDKKTPPLDLRDRLERRVFEDVHGVIAGMFRRSAKMESEALRKAIAGLRGESPEHFGVTNEEQIAVLRNVQGKIRLKETRAAERREIQRKLAAGLGVSPSGTAGDIPSSSGVGSVIGTIDELHDEQDINSGPPSPSSSSALMSSSVGGLSSSTFWENTRTFDTPKRRSLFEGVEHDVSTMRCWEDDDDVAAGDDGETPRPAPVARVSRLAELLAMNDDTDSQSGGEGDGDDTDGRARARASTEGSNTSAKGAAKSKSIESQTTSDPKPDASSSVGSDFKWKCRQVIRAVQVLRDLPTIAAPADKLNALVSATQLASSIEPTMGADDLLPLFTCVIALAEPDSLQAEFEIMTAFISDDGFFSIRGYALSTLQMTIECIKQIFDEGTGRSSSLSGLTRDSKEPSPTVSRRPSDLSPADVSKSENVATLAIEALPSGLRSLGGFLGGLVERREFHERFDLPVTEKVVSYYSCVWLPTGSWSGRRGWLYISDHHLCYEALPIFPGTPEWKCHVTAVRGVQPTKFAFIMPTGMEISLDDGTSRFFANFTDRRGALEDILERCGAHGVKMQPIEERTAEPPRDTSSSSSAHQRRVERARSAIVGAGGQRAPGSGRATSPVSAADDADDDDRAAASWALQQAGLTSPLGPVSPISEKDRLRMLSTGAGMGHQSPRPPRPPNGMLTPRTPTGAPDVVRSKSDSFSSPRPRAASTDTPDSKGRPRPRSGSFVLDVSRRRGTVGVGSGSNVTRVGSGGSGGSSEEIGYGTTNTSPANHRRSGSFIAVTSPAMTPVSHPSPRKGGDSSARCSGVQGVEEVEDEDCTNNDRIRADSNVEIEMTLRSKKGPVSGGDQTGQHSAHTTPPPSPSQRPPVSTPTSDTPNANEGTPKMPSDSERSVVHKAARYLSPSSGEKLLQIGAPDTDALVAIAHALLPSGHMTVVESDEDRAEAAEVVMKTAGVQDYVSVSCCDKVGYLKLQRDGLFDAVGLHIAQPGSATQCERLVRHSARVLKPGGRLCIAMRTENAIEKKDWWGARVWSGLAPSVGAGGAGASLNLSPGPIVRAQKLDVLTTRGMIADGVAFEVVLAQKHKPGAKPEGKQENKQEGKQEAKQEGDGSK